MAKRTIIECDLTKQEIEDEETVFTLKIAKKGKRNYQTFELSAEAAEKLLSQLNGRNELTEDWQFSKPGGLHYPPGVRSAEVYNQPEGSPPEKRTLGDLDVADDSSFVAEKKASLREAGVLGDEDDESPRESQDGPVAKAMGGASNGCRHINKGRVQVTMRDGKRFVYRKCNECRQDIPEKSADEKRDYMSGKAPDGVRIRDL